MAAVAPSGAKEALSYPDSPPTTPSRPSPSVGRSPRSQAFVMTGDKILSLDHHISPSYAKVVRDQLPPRTQIQETPRRPPLTDFPSVRRSLRSRLPISISQPEVVTSKKEAEPSIERVTQTVVDPIDESTPSIATISSTEPQQAVISNEKTEKETDVCPLTASTSLVNSPTEVQKNAVMDSSMHSSYYKTAFSNPQLDHRTASNETFVISAADSSAKMSTVTVNPTTYIGTSVSAANSPSLRRVLGTKNTSQTEIAAVAPSGAKEALSYPDSPPTTPSRPSPSVGRSPRSQAFVMTGDKILSLDHHISPSYAKVVRDQLPPRTQIQETPRRPPLTDFPSVRRSLRSRLPISISQPEVVTSKKEAEPSIERVTQTVVDPIDESTPSIATISSTEPQQAVISNEKTEKETDVCPLTASTSLVNSPTEVQKNAVMDSSMHSSYYKTAFSNPQLDHRTASNETFVISAADSSAKMSTVTVNPTTYIGTSVSAANSPSLRRVLGTKNTSQTVDSFGSFRSEFMSESVSSEEPSFNNKTSIY